MLLLIRCSYTGNWNYPITPKTLNYAANVAQSPGMEQFQLHLVFGMLLLRFRRDHEVSCTSALYI